MTTLRIACVAGVNGEGEGERERGRKWGTGGYLPEPNFSPMFSLPFPFPVYACYAGYPKNGCVGDYGLIYRYFCSVLLIFPWFSYLISDEYEHSVIQPGISGS